MHNYQSTTKTIIFLGVLSLVLPKSIFCNPIVINDLRAGWHNIAGTSQSVDQFLTNYSQVSQIFSYQNNGWKQDLNSASTQGYPVLTGVLEPSRGYWINIPLIKDKPIVTGNKDTIAISYVLAQFDGNPFDLEFSYSSDNGATYSTSSNIRGNISSITAGQNTILWDSHLDNLASSSQQKIKIRLNNNNSNFSVQSLPFNFEGTLVTSPSLSQMTIITHTQFNISPSSTFFSHESQEIHFTIPQNAISFSINAFHQQNKDIAISSLRSPIPQGQLQSTQLLNYNNENEYWNLNIIPEIKSSFNALHFPKETLENIVAAPGLWSYKIGLREHSTNIETKITIRTSTQEHTEEIHIQPYYCGNGNTYSLNQVNQAVQTIKTIYEGNGQNIKVVLQDTKIISSINYVADDFNDSQTSLLLKSGSSDSVNIYFIEDWDYNNSTLDASGTLGIAASIPGSFGIQSSWNGVIINLALHGTPNTANIEFLGKTATHEVGHWLGLYHTTENGGTLFDPLVDTAKCPTFYNNPAKCTDGTNLMFWLADPSQSIITQDQYLILRKSPIVR